MAINKGAGRTVKDCSRYPFMPWCLQSMALDIIKLQEPSTFRDLSKPLGFILENERSAAYEEHYKNMVRDKDPHPYFMGTFPSNPATSIYYLFRLEPAASAWKALHGKSHEVPERVFHSLPKHFDSLTRVGQDIKEAIPEMYYLPESLLNLNKLTFETRSDDNWRLDTPELPKWSRNSPALFVYLHRMVLECDYVSEHLPTWIDNHFGINTVGKKAIENKNVYPPLIYADTALKKLKSAPSADTIAVYSQIYHFGQLTGRVFDSVHPNKNKSLRQFKTTCYSNKPLKVFTALQAESSKILNLLRQADVYISKDTIIVATSSSIKTIKHSVGRQKEGRVERIGSTVSKQVEVNKLVTLPSNFYNYVRFVPSCVWHSQNVLVVAGYLEGIIRFIDLNSGEETKSLRPTGDIITAVACTSTHFAAGCANGELLVWQAGSNLNLKRHMRVVGKLAGNLVFIAMLPALSLLVASCSEGRMLLANYVDGRLLRVFKQAEQHQIDYACVSVRSSPACVVYSVCKSNTLYSYTLNGLFVSKLKVSTRPASKLFVVTALDFSELLVYVDRKYCLNVLQLPYLKLVSSTQLKLDHEHVEIVSAAVEQHSGMLVLVLTNGDVFYLLPN